MTFQNNIFESIIQFSSTSRFWDTIEWLCVPYQSFWVISHFTLSSFCYVYMCFTFIFIVELRAAAMYIAICRSLQYLDNPARYHRLLHIVAALVEPEHCINDSPINGLYTIQAPCVSALQAHTPSTAYLPSKPSPHMCIRCVQYIDIYMYMKGRSPCTFHHTSC